MFDKEKHVAKSCVPLEDREAEAEAAASAVAVAAISNDEIVGNGLRICPVSVSDTKSFGGTGINGNNSHMMILFTIVRNLDIEDIMNSNK